SWACRNFGRNDRVPSRRYITGVSGSPRPPYDPGVCLPLALGLGRPSSAHPPFSCAHEWRGAAVSGLLHPRSLPQPPGDPPRGLGTVALRHERTDRNTLAMHMPLGSVQPVRSLMLGAPIMPDALSPATAANARVRWGTSPVWNCTSASLIPR